MPPSGRDSVPLWVLVLFLADAAIIGFIVGATVSPWAGLLAAAAGLALPVLTIPPAVFLLTLITGWSRLARTYPACEPGDEALRGLAPALAVRWRWVSFNMCVRWAADEAFLHLRIVPPFGTMTSPMSIPWKEIDFNEDEVMRASRGFVSGGTVRLDTAAGIPVFAPASAVGAECARRLASASV
jgi:hypothetical protein